jgi:clan AA aspartic protease
MISGVVTTDREAVIWLVMRGAAGQEHQVEAVVDTGFDGWFSLPPALIAQLDLEWRRRGRALLADGSECVFDIYEGTVEWDGKPVRVAIDEASTAPLVGMALLEGYELNIQVRNGGSVTIKALMSRQGAQHGISGLLRQEETPRLCSFKRRFPIPFSQEVTT